jgi:hypothetical protein
MSSVNSISPEKHARLIGLPRGPALIDVRTDEDREADPRFALGALLRRPESVSEWASEFVGRPTIVIDKSSPHMSEAAPAWLRLAGAASSDMLPGGHLACVKSGGPFVPAAKVPRRDALGRTIWVMRSRPKIDRVACSWLIRRFLDPSAVSLGAPFVEKVCDDKALAGASSAIAVAVVGVILNLAIWSATHAPFREVVALRGMGSSFEFPDLTNGAALSLFRVDAAPRTLALSTAAGVLLCLIGASPGRRCVVRNAASIRFAAAVAP